MEKTIPQKLAETCLTDMPKEAMKYFHDPIGTQKSVLMEILKLSAQTEYGKKYDFDNIKSVEDFVNKVPLSTWQDYAPYALRMEDGEEDLLFPGKPQYFIMTTGTTGKNKMIPESTAGAAGKSAITALRNIIQLLAFMKKAGITDLNRPLSELGHVLALVNSASTSTTKNGIPVGFASGITSGQVDKEISKMMCYPLEILNIPDAKSVEYMIMRFALSFNDIMAATGNNAVRFTTLIEYAKDNAQMLIDDIEKGVISQSITMPDDIRKLVLSYIKPNKKRADELQSILDSGVENFIPKNYWKDFSFNCFWLGGTVGVYIDEVKKYLPEDVIFFDMGYGASELKFNVVTMPNTPYGAVGTFLGFFEFIPQEGGEPVFIDELKDGGVYEIVITTYSGLYRYKMGDYIKVEGKTAATPNIMFLSKTGDVASIANEKMSGETLGRTARKTLSDLGSELVFCQIYPHQGEKNYHCFMEIKGEKLDAAKMAALFDENLKEEAGAYSRRRVDGSINKPQVFIMKKGWQQSLYNEKLKQGVSVAQIKLPVVLKEYPNNKWMD